MQFFLPVLVIHLRILWCFNSFYPVIYSSVYYCGCISQACSECLLMWTNPVIKSGAPFMLINIPMAFQCCHLKLGVSGCNLHITWGNSSGFVWSKPPVYGGLFVVKCRRLNVKGEFPHSIWDLAVNCADMSLKSKCVSSSNGLWPWIKQFTHKIM